VEQRVVVEAEVLGDGDRVLPDLFAGGVAPLGHVPDFFEQRQVLVGLDVAVDARIPVPVPGSAEVPGLVDRPDLPDAGLAQARAGEQAAEAAADHRHFDAVVNRRPLGALGVRIGGVVTEFARRAPVLGRAVRAEAAIPFVPVLGAQGFGVEAELLGGEPSACRDCRVGGHAFPFGACAGKIDFSSQAVT
jgi:hypothetical protein